jgi:hypothetical protein
MTEVHVNPIFAAFEYADNASSEAAFHRADADPEVNNVSVWRSIANGRYVIIVLGEDQAKVDRAAEAVTPEALGNFLLDQATMESLMKRRYKTAFKHAEAVQRGGKTTMQQRAHYGQGVPFIDGEPRP